MASPPSITRAPLRLSHDADRDRLLLCEYGAVPETRLEGYTAPIGERLRFLLRRPRGTVIGFEISGLGSLDVEAHEPCLWSKPRFRVPALGLRSGCIAEIVLRTRAGFAGSTTADVIAARRAADLASAGDHAGAEEALRDALVAGDMRAHLGVAAGLCARARYAEAYDHARIYTELAPKDSWGWAWLGRACLELGDKAEAETCLRRAVRLEHEGSHRTPASKVLRSLESRDERKAA